MKLLLPLLIILFLSACDGPLSFLTGGGPNVAANVQAGQTNQQTIGQTNNTAPTVSLRPNARVETIEQNQTSNYQLPFWVWVVFIFTWILGWVTDTPMTIWNRLFKTK